MERLKTIWNQLTSQYTEDQQLIENTWEFLNRQYTEEFRKYHNWNHISVLVNHIFQYEGEWDNIHEVLFAAYFHDCIYVPGDQQNEVRSVELADEWLNHLDVPDAMINNVVELIKCTAGHKANGTNDAALFLDLDLLILGANPTDYSNYINSLREEYRQFPDETYYPGRRAFLERFIKAKHIFHTEKIAEKYNNQARRNMRYELQEILKNK